MSKLPYMQFYTSDYLIDTAVLSLAAQGAWMRILCALHSSETRGSKTWRLEVWARYIGVTADVTAQLFAEIAEAGVGGVEEANGNVTLTNRRMLADSITKEQTRLRVQNHRERQKSAGVVPACNTDGNGECNGDITDKKSEVRSQKSEDNTTPSNSCPKPPATDEKKPEKVKPSKHPNSEAERFVDWFLSLLAETGAPTPKLTPSNRYGWADAYDKMLRLDGRTKEQVKAVCNWARNDDFWRKNFLSPAKLRESNGGILRFDEFIAKMGGVPAQKPAVVTLPEPHAWREFVAKAFPTCPYAPGQPKHGATWAQVELPHQRMTIEAIAKEAKTP